MASGRKLPSGRTATWVNVGFQPDLGSLTPLPLVGGGEQLELGSYRVDHAPLARDRPPFGGWGDTCVLGGVCTVMGFLLLPDIVKNKIIHFDLLHEDVSLQYFIPALS